jgi:hypothetical protein
MQRSGRREAAPAPSDPAAAVDEEGGQQQQQQLAGADSEQGRRASDEAERDEGGNAGVTRCSFEAVGGKGEGGQQVAHGVLMSAECDGCSSGCVQACVCACMASAFFVCVLWW